MSDNISEPEISSLEHRLFAQQSLLQKLHNELDAEREASASAASEALSVILRLQHEKAAVKLEAEQYRRLSEQKMSHAEESIAIIEDIIYHKELEVAALDCQVQAYRYKLLSTGCANFGFNGDTKFGECLCENGFMERQIFVPSCSSFKYKNDSCSWEVDCDESLDSDRNIDDNSVDSYWEQIRKLDDRVKEIAGFDQNTVDPRVEKRPPSPQTSSRKSADLEEKGVGVLDVFEVPQMGNSISYASRKKDDNRTGNDDFVHKRATEENKMNDKPDWLKKVLKPVNYENGFFEPSCNTSIECRLAVMGPKMCSLEPRNGCCLLDGTSEIVEVERPIKPTANRDEELRLFNEIKESLNSLHEEIKGLKEKKCLKNDEPSLCALSEAMVYFWL